MSDDYKTGKVNLTGDGEWMMIYYEEKLYDERKQSHKDFAMRSEDFTEGEIVPRLVSILLGDIFTTNAFVGAAASDTAKTDGPSLTVGDKLYVAANGYLDSTQADGPVFQVVKEYTLADGQPAVKLMRIE